MNHITVTSWWARWRIKSPASPLFVYSTVYSGAYQRNSHLVKFQLLSSWMFCCKTNLNKLEKLQERALRFVFRDITSPYMQPHLNGKLSAVSVQNPCLAINAFMGIIPPIWIIYLVSPFWNMILEIHVALNNQNLIPLHTASGPFVT